MFLRANGATLYPISPPSYWPDSFMKIARGVATTNKYAWIPNFQSLMEDTESFLLTMNNVSALVVKLQLSRINQRDQLFIDLSSPFIDTRTQETEERF